MLYIRSNKLALSFLGVLITLYSGSAAAFGTVRPAAQAVSHSGGYSAHRAIPEDRVECNPSRLPASAVSLGRAEPSDAEETYFCSADLNQDLEVNLADQQAILQHFGQEASDSLSSLDLTQDGRIDALDLAQVLAAYGPCKSCQADLNGDGTIDQLDVNRLTLMWGRVEGSNSRADLNADGTINAEDLAAVLNQFGICPQ